MNKFAIAGFAIALGLCAIRRHYNGAVCKLRRDLTGQVAIVTGGNTGIGLEVALGLAREHCTVIIIARDIGKCEKAAKYTKKHSGNEAVEYRQVDIACLSSIDRFVDEMKAKFKKVNILVNNAGVSALRTLTLNEYGFDMIMAVNHFGHFYLTAKLWSLLRDAEDLRIVNVSSLAQRVVRHFGNGIDFDFDDLDGRKAYNTWRQYSRSKQANIMFTQELAERVEKINP